MTELEALRKAVKLAGGQTQLADALSKRTNHPIKQAHVWNWLNRSKRLPERYALHVEAILDGKVKASQLCHFAFSAA